MQLYDRIQETLAFIRSKSSMHAEVAIILGSGLGALAEKAEIEARIPYESIPNFPKSTVEGHAGELLLGRLGGKPVVMMSGRFHFYEGYSMEEITFPVRVIHALGASVLIVSNAAGGMNVHYGIGDIVILEDHINLFPEHPLRGANDDRLGPRFPDMSEPYDQQIISKAREIGAEMNLTLFQGVYAGLSGPTFETPAEYRWLRTIGADLVGMSTVPEVIVAIHSGMKCFGASIVTDLGIPENPTSITHEEVLEAAQAAAPKFSELVKRLIAAI
jgi:purine-nucleoside phosphorylase